MRNLCLATRLSFQHKDLEDVQVVCVDTDTEDVYVVTRTTLWKFNARSNALQHCVDIPQKVACSLPNNKCNSVIALSYLSEQQDVCITTGFGDLYFYNSLTQELTCVGSVDSGVQAAAWSPDGDIFVLTTGEQRLILMTRDFLPVQEVPMFSEEFGETKPVTVGWGKKETQFHGSEGKTAAVTSKEIPSSVPSWDDRKPRISWRGDGQLFAVCTVDPVLDVRKIRIFSRDGSLQATSENVIGLEAEISWRPSGSVIAAVQRLSDVYQIAFFEKNGLRHKEFALPTEPNEAIVKNLTWNTDSTLLAIWLDSFAHEKPAKVLIWTMNNYHWYLKQTLFMPMGKEPRSLLWDASFPLMLHCITPGCYLQYNWVWTVNHSQQTTVKDAAAVAVIDGERLLITPFRSVLVPPPLSAYELNLPCPVNHAVFSNTDSSVNLAAVLADNTVAFYEEVPNPSQLQTGLGDSMRTSSGKNGFKSVFGGHSLKSFFRLKWDDSFGPEAELPLYLHHWQWLNNSTMVAVCTYGATSAVCRIRIDHELEELLVCFVNYVDGVVGQTCPSSDGQNLMIELEDGKLQMYSTDSDLVLPWTDKLGKQVAFFHFCSSVQSVNIAGKEVIVGLTERYRLFVNDVEVLNNATSFAVANNFLLVTTLDHMLRAIPLHCLKEPSTMNYDGEGVRSVERGSRIVLAVPEDTKVVLQMPRGNLETIHPRALVLSIVGQHLDHLRYCDAFILMRKHRINMNLMHDHNPQLFLANVDKFVSEVNNVNWLNIFLSDLIDEDVTTTLYTALYPGRTESSGHGLEKVNRICTTLKQSLESNEPKYLLSILTSLVMMKPPELDSALNLIKCFKDKQDSRISVDEALGYLTYLVDVNTLYNVALGTYDFDLVVMVAQKSQKDPKEYLPFLNDLRKMEPNYQKFSIDCHLKKPLKALEHISRCGEQYYSECLEYIRNNNLYSNALMLLPSHCEQYKVRYDHLVRMVELDLGETLVRLKADLQALINYKKAICVAYGNYLGEKHRHDEAGLFYYRAGQPELALMSFEKSLNWQHAMSMAAIVALPNSQLQALAGRMSARLKDQHQYISAADLLERYVKDYQETIITLLDGQAWELALEKIYFHQLKGMITSHMKPSLLEHCKGTLSTIEHKSSTLTRHTARLVVVREEKSRTNLTDEELLGGIPSDVASDISSVTGFSQTSTASRATSRATARTSKNRRKLERKKQSLKEGSPYEDLALLDALTEIYTSVDKMREECSSTIKMLVYFGYDNEAKQLDWCLKSLIDLMKINQKQIWPPTGVVSAESLTGPATTANEIAASMIQQSNTFNSSDFALSVPPKTRLDHHWQLDFLAH